MKGKDIFLGLNYVGTDLIEKAEKNPFPAEEREKGGGAEPARKPVRLGRPFLIAAVIALMLLLVGCATAVVLHLDKLKIAEESYMSKPRYTRDGTKVLPTEKMQGTYVLAGESSNCRLAVQEWRDFIQEYDPDGSKLAQAYDEGKSEEYNQAMDEKAEEIREKYGLGKTGEAVIILQSDEALFRELVGVENLGKRDGSLELEFGGARICECGNFNVSYSAVLKNADSGEDLMFTLTYDYRDNAYFARDSIFTIEDQEGLQQWNCTLSGGENVLIVMENEGDARILYDRGDAFLTICVANVGWDWLSPSETMSHRDMERIGESLVLSPKPEKVPNMAQLQEELDRKYRDENNFTIPPEEMEERTRIFEENERLDSFGALVARMRDNESYFTSQKGSDYENFWETMDYILMDVTGDGEEDLILGKNGLAFSIWTMQEGKTAAIASAEEGTLYEGNVLKDYHFVDGKPYHYFFRLDEGSFMASYLDVEYSISEESWLRITYENGQEKREKITEEQADEILQSFTPMALDWKPIREFPMN